MDKTKYVVGFAFDLTLTMVALIRKNRPEWQMGLLNGIGDIQKKMNYHQML